MFGSAWRSSRLACVELHTTCANEIPPPSHPHRSLMMISNGIAGFSRHRAVVTKKQLRFDYSVIHVEPCNVCSGKTTGAAIPPKVIR